MMDLYHLHKYSKLVLGSHLDGGHVVWIPLEFLSAFRGKNVSGMWVLWVVVVIS